MATAIPRIAAGATLRCADGRLILLGREVKRGGAGTIHLLPQAPQQVAKIYHPGSDLARAERKLAAMLALSPELPDIAEHGRRYVQIAWPQATLHDEQQRFVGFLMPTLDLKLTSELECVLQERQARKLGLPTGLGARVTLAANLAAVIAELHRHGHRVIDLKPINLRFYPSSLYMAVLDCDGFAIAGATERFPAEQVTPDYLAPELQHRAPGADDEEAQDRFALAVMAFQLINHGIHPYAGRPRSDRVRDDLPGRIAGNHYGYGVAGHPEILPTPGSSHDLLPLDLRVAFDRSFGIDAAARPSASAWRDLLLGYARRSSGRLQTCAADAAHQHFVGMACGECRRASARRRIAEHSADDARPRRDRPIDSRTTSLPSLTGWSPAGYRLGSAVRKQMLAARNSPLALVQKFLGGLGIGAFMLLMIGLAIFPPNRDTPRPRVAPPRPATPAATPAPVPATPQTPALWIEGRAWPSAVAKVTDRIRPMDLAALRLRGPWASGTRVSYVLFRDGGSLGRRDAEWRTSTNYQWLELPDLRPWPTGHYLVEVVTPEGETLSREFSVQP